MSMSFTSYIIIKIHAHLNNKGRHSLQFIDEVNEQTVMLQIVHVHKSKEQLIWTVSTEGFHTM